eukprot:2010471-Rhodomonas_salina.1
MQAGAGGQHEGWLYRATDGTGCFGCCKTRTYKLRWVSADPQTQVLQVWQYNIPNNPAAQRSQMAVRRQGISTEMRPPKEHLILDEKLDLSTAQPVEKFDGKVGAGLNVGHMAFEVGRVDAPTDSFATRDAWFAAVQRIQTAKRV